MSKGRLEAFTDGVIAILITIMVLELKVPHGSDWDALRPQVPLFLMYAISFVFLGIYWNNHHHMFQAADKINGKILWANLFLLFWLSLVPSPVGWGKTTSLRCQLPSMAGCYSWPAPLIGSFKTRSLRITARVRGSRRQWEWT